MRSKDLVRSIPLAAAMTAFAAAGPVFAQDGGGTPRDSAQVEVASPNHTLKKTHFKTVNGVFLALTPAFVNAFSDTVVQCPGSGGTCTIAVTVSSQFGSVTAGQVARARVFINGVLAHPGDACCVNLSPNESPRPQTGTMTFVASGVPTGNRVVQVQFSVSAGTGYADFRSLEIKVFKP